MYPSLCLHLFYHFLSLFLTPSPFSTLTPPLLTPFSPPPPPSPPHTVSLQEIHPNSPAAQAGLIPHSDYILGSEMMSAGDDDLYSLIESHDHQEIKLYVYNTDTDNCREVGTIPLQ